MRYSKPFLALVALVGVLGGCAATTRSRPGAITLTAPAATAAPRTGGASAAAATATDQVVATERAFAKTMADRDFKAFTNFLSNEAVFFSGNTVQHGSAAVALQWRPYFDGAQAPFAWTPDHVEVLPSGKLALSTGPVYQQGRIVGRFNSIWRLESPNTWRIVFDKGEAVCSATP